MKQRAIWFALALALGACKDTPPETPTGAAGAKPTSPAPAETTESPAPEGQPAESTAKTPQTPETGLIVRDTMTMPTRLAEGPNGRIYVSDAEVGSVFVLDELLRIVGELKGLDHPLGVAVTADGDLLVGSSAEKSISVWSPQGERKGTIGAGTLKMPNDLAIDADGLLYVADSLADSVFVFGKDGALYRTIGGTGSEPGQLVFPSTVCIAYRAGKGGELYVGDQGNYRVQVFSLDGTFLRTFGSAPEAFTDDIEGRFVKLQSLFVDGGGSLHAVDSNLSLVQVLDADSGAYVAQYGGFGTAKKQLNLPLDLLVTTDGRVIVANAGNRRVEVIQEVATTSSEGE